eukprot:TRINITY_DN12144_c0_g1_i14.p1 TRINITY_DN12144_c0_g1~~TRINITY_DN12144_c0_g1_i14.p1  ORF type:complete len:311 (-),score=87.77 TRINITY_DN12144_c0_g1_i14:157-1089(-)
MCIRDSNTGNESASPDKVSPFESGKSAVIVSARERPSPVRAKSIRTNLSAVHEYLQALISLIKSQFINLFITNINIPLGANPIERLKSYHVVDPAANDSFSLDSSQIQAPPVLGIELFLALEDELARRRGNNLPEEVLELEHIHNKLIFDALNEILDEFRPFGLKGKPAPWRNSSRKVFFKRITVETALDVLDKAKERVVEWASSMCGFIHDKDDNLLGRDLHLDEDYINHIKEDRLARMLANEAYENEERWITYEEEETEVAFDLADLVFETLIAECVEEVSRIQNKRAPARPANPRMQTRPQGRSLSP